jgi:hypothetical protein
MCECRFWVDSERTLKGGYHVNQTFGGGALRVPDLKGYAGVSEPETLTARSLRVFDGEGRQENSNCPEDVLGAHGYRLPRFSFLLLDLTPSRSIFRWSLTAMPRAWSEIARRPTCVSHNSSCRMYRPSSRNSVASDYPRLKESRQSGGSEI